MTRRKSKKLSLVAEGRGGDPSSRTTSRDTSTPSSGTRAEDYMIETVAAPSGTSLPMTARKPRSTHSVYRRNSTSEPAPASVSALAIAPASTSTPAPAQARTSFPASASAPAQARTSFPPSALAPAEAPTSAPNQSNTVPGTPNSESSAVGDVQHRRSGRGMNNPKRAPPNGTKWICRWEGGQPIGDEAGDLANVLGTFARQGSFFPLHMEWGKQHNLSWELVWTDLQNKFSWQGSPNPDNLEEILPIDLQIVKHWCMESIQKKVRDWRARVKRSYYDVWVNLSRDERQHFKLDSRIQLDDWKLLVNYFEEENKQNEVARNSINRHKERAIHTTGSRSMIRAKEKWRTDMGDSYTALHGYISAHKRQRGNGDYPDEKTSAFCEAVAEKSRELNLANCKESSALSPALDAVFHGHHGGYERGVGVGYSRRLMRVIADAPSGSGQVSQSEFDKLKEQNAELTQRMQEMEKRFEELRWYGSRTLQDQAEADGDGL